jgi:peptidoglycan/xylan/chitin deacetylase (PgdA/CDA1 family)
MKRLTSLLTALLVLAAFAIPVFSVSADPAANLIANPSVETASNDTPANWTANSWGNNTSNLTYKSEGRTGSRSLAIDMSAHTDGDAKWMADAVDVTAGKTYTYSSFYKATGNTEIDLQYTDASGNISYQYMQSVAPTADWTQLTTEFTVPENITKVTVLHIVAEAGTLQLDDFSLIEKVALPAPTSGNFIANPSVETGNGTTPANWTANKWGTNNAVSTYADGGHDDTKSLMINMSAYTDGDAKWMHDAIAVTGNKAYTYTGFYKSNVETELDLQYTDAEGNVTYAYGQSVPASNDWAQTTLNFTTPANAVKVVVMHVIAQNGTLQTDEFSLTESVVLPPVDDDNLIANGSMETANGNMPAGWSSNNWGTNTTQFTYNTTGRTDSRSVTTTVSAYTDGDAKWYANPTDVVAGKTYIYRHYFKSTAQTSAFAAYVDAAGNWSYVELGNIAASADWKLYETNITVPAGAVKATIFHVLNRTGSLTIDDAVMMVYAPSSSAIIPNGSLETANGSNPAGWNKSNWGSNTPSYEYVNEGHTGNKSIKLTVSNYTDGDAKWYFEPIDTLTPGQQYRFTTWFKGTAVPHAVALYLDANGNEQYVGLPSPQTVSATTWTKYSDTFTVPDNAVGVSVFMYVASNGWLQTDDYSIDAYHPNGFNRPLLTLTFDDGWEDNVNNALPLLNQYGFKTTQCYATTFMEGQSQTVLQSARAFYNTGHEICSHTVTHPMLTTLNNTNLNYELQHSQQYLQGLFGVPVTNFASPYGDYNANVNDAIDNLYRSHRTVDEGFNSKDNFDIYRLRVQNVLDTTTAAQVQHWVEQAQTDNTWLVLVYHRVANDPGPYDSYISDFAAQLEVIKNSGITVLTTNDALNEVTAQL